MKKLIITDEMLKQPMAVSGKTSNLYRLEDGSILKVFKDAFIEKAINNKIDLEMKVLNSEKLVSPYRIDLPTGVAYNKSGSFKGYTMEEVEGQNFRSFMMGLTHDEKCDLNRHALIYSNLESIVKNNPTIVFPDMCTRENFIINNSLDITAIDFDGLQIGDEGVFCMSDMLGSYEQYINFKYMDHNGNFTKQLDKKSLMYMYFLNTFSIKLSVIDQQLTLERKAKLLSKIFSYLGLDDYGIIEKVWKIYQEDKDNEYLGDDVFRLADKYRIEYSSEAFTEDGICMKYLVRK